MPALRLPAVDPASVPEKIGSPFPEPFRSRLRARSKRRLGDACGLRQLGVNLVTIPPGGESALRHWHTLEDEFVYMLSGELVLITDEGEQTLTTGMCAGYPARTRNAHHMVNRGREPATYLEVGSRVEGDAAFYPDDDLMWIEREDGRTVVHKDGTPYPGG